MNTTEPNTATVVSTEVHLVPPNLFEAGRTMAAALDPVRREQLRRDFYRELEGDFADGYNQVATSTHEGAR